MKEPQRNDSMESLTLQCKTAVQSMLDEARSIGLHPYVFEAKRTIERQWWLFGKGRTSAELKKYGVPEGYSDYRVKKRTRTLDSRHLTGNAVDIVFDIDKDPKRRVPAWSGDYKKLIEIGKKYGLHNLAPLELCHRQI